MGDRAPRVVVVDDDEDLRDLVVQLLEVLGFESAGYADARAALAELRRPVRVSAGARRRRRGPRPAP